MNTTVGRVEKATGLVFRKSVAKPQTLALVAIMLALLPAASYAVDKIWVGSASSSWGSSGNWSPNGVPANGDTVIFNGSGSFTNIDLNSARVLKAMSITTGQTETVTINAATNETLNFKSAGNVLSVAVGNHRIVGTGTGSSDATQDVYFEGGANTNDISSGASFEIQGRIRTSQSTNNFTKIGGGTLILSGNSGGSSAWNFSSGNGFLIQEGALRLAASGAAGNSANIFIVSSGAALEISGNSSHGVSNATWTISGSGISGNGALRSISGANALTSTGTGTVALASASSIGVDSGTLTIRRRVSGSNALTKVGAGTLMLTATNTYTGATIVQAGTLSLGTNNTLSASSAVTLSGGALAVVGSSSNALSTLTLSGDSTIDLGGNTGSLSFANSSGVPWTGTLSLTGTLGDKTLRFGLDANGLSGTQKNMITANGTPIHLNKDGYVVVTLGTVLIIQ